MIKYPVSRDESQKAIASLCGESYDVRFLPCEDYPETKRYAEHTTFVFRNPFAVSVSDMHMFKPTEYFLFR